MNDVSYVEMVRMARADKEHLSFIDLPEGSRTPVLIAEVIVKKDVKGAKGRVHKEVPFLRFDGKTKLLWLTTGKLKALKSLHGKDAAAWIGKEVVLYADPTVKFGGEEVGGIVIEAKKG